MCVVVSVRVRACVCGAVSNIFIPLFIPLFILVSVRVWCGVYCAVSNAVCPAVCPCGLSVRVVREARKGGTNMGEDEHGS